MTQARSYTSNTVLATLSLLALANVVVGCTEPDSCVEEDTLIATPSGDRAIGEVEVGDSIWSVDPDSGTKTLGRVSRVVRAWAWCEKLDLGSESLWLTAEHPLYSPELGEFRTAEHWLQGELATTLGADGAAMSTERGAWHEQRPCRVIDLTVESEPHTFIAAGIVVHNKSFPPDNSCVDDDDCPPSPFEYDKAICENGFCRPDKSCVDTDDCFFADEICEDGFCRFADCSSDGECNASEVCSDGRCVPRSGGGDPVSIQVVSFGDVLAAVGDPETVGQVPIPGCTRTDISEATTDVTFDCPDPGPGDYQVSVTATGMQTASVRVGGETQDTVRLMTGQGAFLPFTLPIEVPACDPNDCDPNEVCIDDSCAPGTLVFVTSATFDGDLGGLTGADLACAEASQPIRSAPFFAWVSTDEGSPATGFPKQTVPYYRLDGARIADDWDDLVDGQIRNPINIDETGNTLPAGSRVWSSTSNLDGTLVRPNCDEHRDNSAAVRGVIGDVSATSGAWSAEGNRDCNLQFHIYCFEAHP